jgi:hypothetical protein
MKRAISKTSDTVIPAITPSMKKAISEIRGAKSDFDDDSKEEQLIEAKKLLDDKLISEDEYMQMRKSILDIKD